jgi:inhibitor of KinA sporulation pathway (predicted exonuclease)
MKKLARLLAHRRTLVFLDFEGTQQSHEMIAIAAIKAEIKDDFTIKKTYKGMHHLVRPKHEVGRYVSQLTKITEVDVVDKGISFAKAMEKLRQYVGRSFQKTAFVIFGNHDLRILNQSLNHSPDATEDIVKTITKNSLDYSLFLSEFVKDLQGNPLSLVNNLLMFNTPFDGVNHHPLDDAKNLMKLYRLVLENKPILIQQYVQVLTRMRHVPEPVKMVIQHLLNHHTIDETLFMKWIKEYIG